MPGMKRKSDRVYVSNYYSRKGITHIELRICRYRNTGGIMKEKHYLYLGFNASAMMGGSRVYALDLNKHRPAQITAQILKRIYEVNELRICGIHKIGIEQWHLDRIDLTLDVKVPDPRLFINMLNLSLPFGFCGMKPFRKSEFQQMESCYFQNGTRAFNIYDKLSEINNHKIVINDDELEQVRHTVRIEVQLGKKAVANLMRNSQSVNKRNLMDFLDTAFSYGYLEKQVKAVFGAEKYVCLTAALQTISQSRFRRQTKCIMAEIINAVHSYGGLYSLEEAVANRDKGIPSSWGGLQNFRKILKKIRSLGIHPVTLPDSLANSKYSELPSLYGLMQQSQRKGETDNDGINNA